MQFRGDLAIFHLTVVPAQAGSAFVRTNIGHAAVMRREIIRRVERNEPRLAREWFDIPMRIVGEGRYEAVIGLTEVGHFEAKCLFLPQGDSEPLWPDGPNTVVNVEPAHTCSGNIIYNAFVRQFGPDKSGTRTLDPEDARCVRELDRTGYTVIPPSGTFRDVIAELDFILGRLGCRYLQLLPIHPTPTTYGRMGRFGSPYAALSFTEVDPALAAFDPKATPLEQFLELVDAVHQRGGRILIDLAINHTGWAARLHATHPQWLARDESGQIQNPGAWGVVWEDLTHLDYSQPDLWKYMAEVMLTWCRRGVDGFRCDAGYMIPEEAWLYMIAKVRHQFPDTLFFLEGLGGKIAVTRDLLNRGNFNWAYSELFQNYDRAQIERYLPEAMEISATDGITVHFAETHDNNRLAATSEVYARMRTALCALAAPNGAFAFANGVEWLATEKINVHDACSLNWGAETNQVEAIVRLTRLLKTHPAFGAEVEMALIGMGEGNFMALLRRHRPGGRLVLVLANLDWQEEVTAGWDRSRAAGLPDPPVDLLTGRRVPVHTDRERQYLTLAPGQVLCLGDAGDAPDREPFPEGAASSEFRQRMQAKALEVLTHYRPVGPWDLPRAIRQLQDDPEDFCRNANFRNEETRVILWHYPEDLRRVVMVPPDHFLLVWAGHPFQVRLESEDEERVVAVERSLADRRGRHFALVLPGIGKSLPRPLGMSLRLFAPEGTLRRRGRLLYLNAGDAPMVKTAFSRRDCHDGPLVALGTDGRGAMMRVHSDWGRLDSRYDALLAANPSPRHPQDRRVLFTRCRGWIVYQGHSQEIRLDCLERFAYGYRGGARWEYQIPTGQGEHVVLRIRARLADGTANTLHLQVDRPGSHPCQSELDDARPVTLILRPDIEDRNFHHTTKAYTGPEQRWPSAVTPAEDGFAFATAQDHGLRVRMDRGRFVPEPEWLYMVHRPLEAQRGLDPDSDLFSPGYFKTTLKGGQCVTLTARAVGRSVDDVADPPPPPVGDRRETAASLPLETALKAALDQYVVRRGAYRTVIAGYPWFLDWGRDTLIVARGLVAAGRWETVEAILMQFARFEMDGTLPNMIHGDDAGDRDTSDAPLWIFTVCADLAATTGNIEFLHRDCNGRSLKQVLIDLARSVISGTPNGVVMDPASGLIFSPAHFTWMDTNYPAATPRQGYPVEIQALWYAALQFLAAVDDAGSDGWRQLAWQVAASIGELFWQPESGYLADCRHGLPGQPAAECRADDALRPNQLLALTLGAVTDPSIGRQVLRACQALLVPGAIRSLADRPVRIPLRIVRDGVELNDPLAPYWGTYGGDEDTRRKAAYHNGTAWTWLMPSYCEAWAAIYGADGLDTARAWLSSAVTLIDRHCIGHVPEIVDGDAPHAQRGCDAQAWGGSELLRVWMKLKNSG